MKGALIMRYIGTEKVVCPACGVELDAPVYQADKIKKYGMKFCHQCGASLFYESDNTEHISQSFLRWLSDSLFQSFCDCKECNSCPFSINKNGFGISCTKLSGEQQLQIFKQIYDEE